MHPRPLLGLSAVAFLITASLSACGSSSSEPAATNATSASTPAATAAKNFADCSAIPAADMAPALGTGTATATVPPASTSCTYALDDPRLASVNIEQFTVHDFAGGWEGAKAKIATTVVGPINGTPVSVANVGDDAEIVAAVSNDSAAPDAIGLVKLGDTIVRASVLDASAKDQRELLVITSQILEVIADHA